MSNSFKTIVGYLNKYPFESENEIMSHCFGYVRNSSSMSNKKYTDMLRRTLHRGDIMRVKANVVGNKSTFFYYTPNFKSSQIGEFRKIVKITPSKKEITDRYVKHKSNQLEVNGEDILLNELIEEAKQRGIVAGAKFRLIQGQVGEVNKKSISNKFYMSDGRLMVGCLCVEGCYTVFNKGEWVEVIEPKVILKEVIKPKQIPKRLIQQPFIVKDTFNLTVNMECVTEYNSIKLTQIAEISFRQDGDGIKKDIIYLTDTNITCMGKPVNNFHMLKIFLGEQLDLDFTEIFDDLFEHNFNFKLKPEIDELEREAKKFFNRFTS
tara:strand:+ start:1328 stop:2290 length:963 start_codon:yes stop_codon:yes gene_type:complete